MGVVIMIALITGLKQNTALHLLMMCIIPNILDTGPNLVTECNHLFSSDDESLMYHLKLVQREAMHHKQRVKNRRFTAMKKLMAAGEYFSDELMKSRDPLLYQQVKLKNSLH